MRHAGLAFGLIFACGAAGYADEIVFKNGDRLTGTVSRLEEHKVTIDSAMAGSVSVDIDKIRTLSTDKPMDVLTGDSKLRRVKLDAAGDGRVKLIPTSGEPASEVAVRDIRSAYEPISKWHGNVQAGAAVTTGNSQTEAVHASLELTRRMQRDRITATGQYNYGRQHESGKDETTVSADNWMGSGKYDHFLGDKLYEYVNGAAEHDAVANLDYRLTPGVGLGYQWIETSRTNINTEAGFSYVYEDYSKGDTNQFLAGRLAYHVDHMLNDRVKLLHDFEILPSLENMGECLIHADAGIRVNLKGNWFAQFTVDLKYNSQPADDAQSTDVGYLTTLGWEF